jgi:hypothetical protein
MAMPLGDATLTDQVRFGFSMPDTLQTPSQVGQP